jgi:NCAIR mutase (PurE)-related protein
MPHRLFSDGTARLTIILQQVKDGQLHPSEAEIMIRDAASDEKSPSHQTSSPEEVLRSFANLDHTRSSRAGFPEAVFGTGKTPDQISRILDDMARNFNDQALSEQGRILNSERAILATR